MKVFLVFVACLVATISADCSTCAKKCQADEEAKMSEAVGNKLETCWTQHGGDEEIDITKVCTATHPPERKPKVEQAMKDCMGGEFNAAKQHIMSCIKCAIKCRV